MGVLLLARALDPTGRGTVAFITVTALVTALLASLGLAEATKVFAATRPGERAAAPGRDTQDGDREGWRAALRHRSETS